LLVGSASRLKFSLNLRREATSFDLDDCPAPLSVLTCFAATVTWAAAAAAGGGGLQVALPRPRCLVVPPSRAWRAPHHVMRSAARGRGGRDACRSQPCQPPRPCDGSGARTCPGRPKQDAPATRPRPRWPHLLMPPHQPPLWQTLVARSACSREARPRNDLPRPCRLSTRRVISSRFLAPVAPQSGAGPAQPL